jgi:hypothetical protein
VAELDVVEPDVAGVLPELVAVVKSAARSSASMLSKSSSSCCFLAFFLLLRHSARKFSRQHSYFVKEGKGDAVDDG